ncbi:LysR substrate-binding domain-containing protein [Pseudoduganella namucuonensis]|uniref:LysR family transcriptional regulator, glycine cleavage system transcriptional activator n=1 Tax=Pseudoduganella namucuonensis TaxID=1035707 RepID=A0A1I7LIP7_9BURK|nr:LysR substrate-binding domain-containing protein [Pseudoduganella namucuonensis]SFV09561.1 LysR family transcriptional regulator, glycine cleavage system transcriptional activator [Pseudoduganella namucuonensis]
MRKLPALGALRVFEAAARRLSFKDAAEELSVTPTAVSHQIKHLEQAIGVPLFERTPRKVALTAAGRLLFPTLRDGFDGFERAIEQVRRAQGSQVATLSSTVAFMARRLATRAGSFRDAYPDWTLRLDASNKLVDLDSDADAAIRYGNGRYPGLLVEHLFQDRFAPVCSPRLNIRTPRDLRKATLIHFEWGEGARDDERAVVWRQWLDGAGVQGVDADAGLAFTEELHAVQATIAGQGIGLLSLTLVAEELAAGVLVRPFELSLESFHYDLVCSPRAAARPAAMILREWVARQFGGAQNEELA